jgi:putative transposase
MDEGRYAKGSHTVYDIKYHIVWKTKYSYGVLKGEVALRTRQILREICIENELRIVSGHVRANHVHLLIAAPTHISPAQIVQYLKGKSSYRLQREYQELQKRYWGQHLWARGYFCATVGAVNEELIKKYIENQSEVDESFKVWDAEPKAEAARPIAKLPANPLKGSLGGFIRNVIGL